MSVDHEQYAGGAGHPINPRPRLDVKELEPFTEVIETIKGRMKEAPRVLSWPRIGQVQKRKQMEDMEVQAAVQTRNQLYIYIYIYIYLSI